MLRCDSTRRSSCLVKWPIAHAAGCLTICWHCTSWPAAWSRTLRPVTKIIVDVMLKPEIRDPQGEAIAGACHRLGFTDVVSVRQGKRFEVEVAQTDTADDTDRAPIIRVSELAAELLANPIIEEFAIHDV